MLPDIREIDYLGLIKAYGDTKWEESPIISGNWDDVPYIRIVPFAAYGASASEECLIESNYSAAMDTFRHWEATGDLFCYRGYLCAYVYRNQDTDKRAGFTRSAIVAFTILSELENYPLLDENDFSEREYHAWRDAIEDELRYLAHDDDSENDIVAINNAFYVAYSDCGMHSFSPDDIGSDVSEHYESARDAYFDARADEIWTAEIPGQTSFDFDNGEATNV